VVKLKLNLNLDLHRKIFTNFWNTQNYKITDLVGLSDGDGHHLRPTLGVGAGFSCFPQVIQAIAGSLAVGLENVDTKAVRKRHALCHTGCSQIAVL
jgi:hypothetical protein